MKKITMHEGASLFALERTIGPIEGVNPELHQNLLFGIQRANETLQAVLDGLKFPGDYYDVICDKKYLREDCYFSLDITWDDPEHSSLYFYFTLHKGESKTKAAFNGGIIFHGWNKVFDHVNNELRLKPDAAMLSPGVATISMHT